MDRRNALIALAAVAPLALPGLAAAQGNYPQKPVRLVVGFAAGSSTDVATRLLAEQLTQRLGQTFIVENKPGASSNIAAKDVAESAPDGYTLFVGTIANAINVSFQPDRSPDLRKAFTPVAMIGSVPNLLVVRPTLGVHSMDELVKLAKSRPCKITMASSGNGTSPHLSGELFASMAGIKLLHVPYKGSSLAVNDLLAGHVDMMFAPASSVLSHIKAGKLVALASTGLERTPAAPELATVDELGLKGFETSVWFGLVAPAGTGAPVVDRLADATRAALEVPAVAAQFQTQGIDPV
ncbi:MAG TPA: tripartite tricarboxylate transporter substrate binding protein, partial [Luteimonas sp.]|nr:tripartite tricarboxylate transporter substrate binding protein [Luteimonas sp.]